MVQEPALENQRPDLRSVLLSTDGQPLEKIVDLSYLKEYSEEIYTHLSDGIILSVGNDIGSSSEPLYLAILRCILHQKDLFPQDAEILNFLDMGSSATLPGIYAAHHGFMSHNIEAIAKYYAKGMSNIERARSNGLIDGKKIKLVLGDMYPKYFKRERESYSLFEYRLHNITLRSPKDSYERLGIDPGDIDVFYHYQVDSKKNLLTFFSKCAKKGAIFVFVDYYKDRCILPDNVIEFGIRNISPSYKLRLYRKA